MALQKMFDFLMQKRDLSNSHTPSRHRAGARTIEDISSLDPDLKALEVDPTAGVTTPPCILRHSWRA